MEYNPYIASNRQNDAGALNTFAKIKGNTKKQGIALSASVFLFEPLTQRTLIIQSDSNGSYTFKGLPKGQTFLVFARDTARKYNAVIQDMVTPK